VRSALDPGAKLDGIAANTQPPPRQLQSAYRLNGLLEQAQGNVINQYPPS
jgi:hypothetical protein